MATQTTHRPYNECDDCGYEWNPRGHNVSLKCPSCKGTSISTFRYNNQSDFDNDGVLWLFRFACALLVFVGAVATTISTVESIQQLSTQPLEELISSIPNPNDDAYSFYLGIFMVLLGVSDWVRLGLLVFGPIKRK